MSVFQKQENEIHEQVQNIFSLTTDAPIFLLVTVHFPFCVVFSFHSVSWRPCHS